MREKPTPPREPDDQSGDEWAKPIKRLRPSWSAGDKPSDEKSRESQPTIPQDYKSLLDEADDLLQDLEPLLEEMVSYDDAGPKESCALHIPDVPFFQPQAIPKELNSAYSDAPFTKCTVCSQVLSDGRLFEVQKVYRGTEVIFEMSVCHSCGESVAEEFSKESLDAMKGFLLCNFKPTVEAQHCHFCGFPRALFSNYTIIGVCRDSSLIFPRILMCEKCTLGLQETLSKKTRDIQGDFVNDNFPGVPEGLDLSPFGSIF